MTRTWTFAAATAVLLAAVWAWAQRPTTVTSSPATSAVMAGALGSSCKPTVPLALEIRPTGTGRWSLELQSLDREHEVVVWMWSGGGGERREVWRGALQPGPARRIDVAFVPAFPQAPVWAALEVHGPEGALMRRISGFDPSGRALQSLAAENGQLLEDPVTGERLLQYEGRPSTTSPGEGR